MKRRISYSRQKMRLAKDTKGTNRRLWINRQCGCSTLMRFFGLKLLITIHPHGMLTALRSFTSRQGIAALECLPKECPPLSNVFFPQRFTRWYIKSSPGRFGTEPNDVSVRNILKKFYNGFERVSGTEIIQELKTDVYFVSPCLSNNMLSGPLC